MTPTWISLERSFLMQNWSIDDANIVKDKDVRGETKVNTLHRQLQLTQESVKGQ